MADTTRQIQGGVQPFVVGDKSFRGIDTYTDPNKLENGFAETIDGLIVDGGSLVLRNGFHGQLPYSYIQTPSTSAGIYEMTPVKGQGSNAGHFIFTQGGELYAFNTVSKVQVALSTNFSATYGMYSPNVRLTTFGKYIYGVPGLKSDGSQSTMPMFRVNTAQFMPVTFTSGAGDMVVNLASPYNTYFVENGSPIRIRLVTGSLPATISPTVTYYVRDYTSGTSVSTFKLSSTLTGTKVAFASATGTYQLVWMAEVIPTITGFPNLSPTVRPYPNSQWALPPVQQNTFIDEAVGPNLITETGGGSTNLIINGTFTNFTTGVAMPATPTGSTGWGPIGSASVMVRQNGYAPTKNYYVGNATNTIDTTATGSSSYKVIQIDGASDAVYQDIPTSGGTPRIPREQINFVDQRQSGNLFEGVIGGVNTTVTFSGSNVSGTFTGTASYPYGSAVQFTTTGALPGGISTNTTYYIINPTGTTTVQLSLTYGGSTAITFTGTGTGVHTMSAAGITTFQPHALTIGQRILTGTPPAGSPTSGLSTSAVEAYVLSTPNNRTFTVSTVSPTGATYASTQGGYVAYKTIQACGQYALSLWALNLDDQNSKTGQSVLVSVQGSDIDGNAIAGAFVSQVLAPPIAKSNGDWVKYTVVVDFRVYQSTLGSMRVIIQNINAQQSADKGIYITNVECYAISPRLGTNSGDYLDKVTNLVKVKAIQNNTSIKGYAGRLKGCAIKLSLGVQATAIMANASNQLQLATLTGGSWNISTDLNAQVRLLSSTTMPVNFATNTTYFATATSSSLQSMLLKNNSIPGNTTYITCGSVPTGQQYALIQKRFDWSKYETISVKLVFPEKLQANIPQIRLGVQEQNYLSTSYDTIEWGGFGQYDINNGYMTWSVRGFGKTRLDSVTQIYLRFETDIDGIQSYDDICWIGDVVVNGNLTAGSKYAYRYTLWYPKDGATAPYNPATGTGTSTVNYLGFESEPTKLTGELTATEALSTNQIVLNPNAEDIVTGSHTHLIIYRRSTSFPDGLYRCIGSVSTNFTNVYGNNLSVKQTTDNKYVLIDNVPEMDVLDDGPKGSQGDVYELGQDMFPTGATTCVVHQSRLWVGNKNTVWVSWFHNIDNEYTINTTHVPLLTDPKVTIKGASFDVSSPYDTEHITGFLPYHGDMMSRNNSTSAVMLVFRENTVYPVTGFDPSNWNIQGFLSEPGIGCIAKRATGTVLGQPWWLNNTGLVQFAGTKVIPVAIQLDGLLSYKPYKVTATTTGAANQSISLADYKNTLMTMHDKRVWLFGPSATYGSFTGATGARTAYVFDTRIQAWSTVSIPNIIGSGGDITGACSIPSSTDTESLYIGAANGQIYQYRDYFDSPFELTPVSINTSLSRVNITSSDWTALLPYDGATIIITSGNTQFATNTTWTITLSVSGGNYFQMRPVGGGSVITLTSSAVFSFRPAVPIDWLYNSRLYGQTYSEGVSYYSRNRPHQLDLHIDTDDTGGSTIQWQLVGANVIRDGTNQIMASDSAMFDAKLYTFRGNTARALRGIPTYLKDINWQIILHGSDAFYPFRIYGAHLHMVESGITRHR